MKTLIRTLGVLFILAFVGCQFPGQLRDGVSIQIQSSSRSIVPDWANVADEYTISLTSSEHSETFTKVVLTLGVVDFPGVPAGTWRVDVVATKAASIVAAGSVSEFEVNPEGGSVATVILVGDQTGEGGYRFELQFPNDAGVTSVDAQLYDDEDNAVGSLLSPTPTVGATETSVVFEQNNIPGGDYRLALTVNRGSAVVGQFSESVNIWTGVISGLWMDPDGSLQTTRTLALGDLAESNTSLAQLVVGANRLLEPAFSSLTTEYEIISPNGVELTLTPTQSLVGQSLEIQIGTGGWTPLPSGETSSTITADVGLTVTLRVTAPDRISTRDYIIGFRVDDVIYQPTNATSGAPPASGVNYEVGDTIWVIGAGTLARTGYQFAGWNTEPDGTGTTVINGATLTATGATLFLYPIWIEDKFTFTNSLDYPELGSYLQLTNVTGAVNGTLVVPEGVTSLGWGFLENDSTVTEVVLPSTLLYITQYSFFQCENLTTLTIPDSVTGIDSSAIVECGLTSITIPAGVTYLGVSAPVQSSFLTSYAVDPANAGFSSIDGALYNKDGTVLRSVPGATSGLYTVRSGVLTVNTHAFSATAITSMVLPSSVTTIHPHAFHSMPQMTSFTVDAGNTTFASVDGLIFSKDLTQLVSVPYALAGVLTIPEGVTSLADNAAVSRHGLTSVVFPSTLTTIGQHALSNINGVSTLTIPATVTYIGPSAFASSYGLTSVTILGTPTMGSYAFDYCNSLTEFTLTSETPPPMEWSWSRPFTAYSPDLVIRVPGTAVDDYKAAQGWMEYADRIVAIP